VSVRAALLDLEDCSVDLEPPDHAELSWDMGEVIDIQDHTTSHLLELFLFVRPTPRPTASPTTTKKRRETMSANRFHPPPLAICG